MKKYRITFAYDVEAKDGERAIDDLIQRLYDTENTVPDREDFIATESSDKGFKAFLEISVDDIFLHAKEIGKPISKADAEKIYEQFDRTDVDCENSTFWSHVQYLIERFLEEKKK